MCLTVIILGLHSLTDSLDDDIQLVIHLLQRLALVRQTLRIDEELLRSGKDASVEGIRRKGRGSAIHVRFPRDMLEDRVDRVGGLTWVLSPSLSFCFADTALAGLPSFMSSTSERSSSSTGLWSGESMTSSSSSIVSSSSRMSTRLAGLSGGAEHTASTSDTH